MKKIILNEEQVKMIITRVGNDSDCCCHKSFPINTDKVLIVKKFLDDGFRRGKIEQIGADGLPSITPIVGMLNSNGEILKNLYKEQLHDLLIDKFKKMFTDKDERREFLGQVMNDWYDNKIGLYGSLSVNHL